MAETNDRPLPAFCFLVNIDGVGVQDIFFKSVSGLRYETEVVDVRAGGVNDTTYRLRGATKWSNLVFKQGFTKGAKLLQWRDEWIRGNCKRSSGSIQLLDTTARRRRSGRSSMVGPANGKSRSSTPRRPSWRSRRLRSRITG
ncbi:MAG: phage tail protein [Myxococcales bacterium]|nr:phage tail protein [Myxococcales bacterium]